MATDKPETPQGKSLEMRLAAIEDKLAQMDISEEDMRTYQRVAKQLGTQAGGSVAAGCVVDCVGCINECGALRSRFRGTPILRTRFRFVCECNECQPCWPGGGGGFGGGGFEGLGS